MFARKIHSTIGALTLLLASSCVEVKHAELYQVPAPAQEVAGIENFYALQIFTDFMNDENWHTEFPQCLTVENKAEFAKGDGGGLKLTWNRQAAGCIWVGMGFGWSGWVPKDISQITDRAAISFYARSTAGNLKSIPWALALEDYSGAQAYAGVFPATIQGGVITETGWTQIIVPLSSFDYRENDFDLTLVKQMIIQFEAEGELIIDQIEVIPYTKGKKQKAHIAQISSDISFDQAFASTQPWLQTDPITIEQHSIALASNDRFLFISATIVDDSPLQNKHTETNIWNGDCLELAWASNADADPYRKFLLRSDHHIGIKLSAAPEVWNWRTAAPIANAQTQVSIEGDRVRIQAAIPLEEIGGVREPNRNYAFEIAIDQGDETGIRNAQYRWNSVYREGFHTNPTLWGAATIIPF
jgi:hypothetical protein